MRACALLSANMKNWSETHTGMKTHTQCESSFWCASRHTVSQEFFDFSKSESAHIKEADWVIHLIEPNAKRIAMSS